MCVLFFHKYVLLNIVHWLLAATSGNKEEDVIEPPKDEDPEGQKLLTTADPLGDAMKWLKPLETLAKDRVDVWVTIYDVTVRQSMLPYLLRKQLIIELNLLQKSWLRRSGL